MAGATVARRISSITFIADAGSLLAAASWVIHAPAEHTLNCHARDLTSRIGLEIQRKLPPRDRERDWKV
jgi:hypothetical protein